MVTENVDFWLKINVSEVWHPRRSETRVNYRGSSQNQMTGIGSLVQDFFCSFRTEVSVLSVTLTIKY